MPFTGSNTYHHTWTIGQVAMWHDIAMPQRRAVLKARAQVVRSNFVGSLRNCLSPSASLGDGISV